MRWVIAATVVLGALGAHAHASQGSDRSLVTALPATQLSAYGRELNLHAAFSSGCTSVSVWRLVLSTAQTLSRPDCKASIYGLFLTSGGAVWATRAPRLDGTVVYGLWESDSGNSAKRFYSSRRAPYGKPIRLRRAVVPAGAPQPLVIGDGAYWFGGAVHYPGFPWAVDPGFPLAPRRLLATETYLAVLTADGVIETYLENSEEDPPQARIHPGAPVRAFKVDRSELLALEHGRIAVFSVHGPPVRTLPLPRARSYGDDRCFVPRCTLAELRLADFEWPYAVYVHGQAVHLLNVKTGRDIVVRRAAPTPVHAQMEATGLTYSAGNRITYVARREIDKLFR